MVDEGFVTPDQLALALAEQKRSGRPLGAIFVELGFVSAGAVANALAEQHGGVLKTEFGVSAGLYALPGGATRQAAAAAADPVAAHKQDLETQLQAVLTERNAFAQRVNEQAARLSESAQAHDAEVARVTDAAATHIAKLDALISELRGEVAELREQAEQRQDDQAHEAEIASVTDAAAAHIAKLEAEAQSALAGRDELISQLQHEIAGLQKAQQGQDDVSAEAATLEAEMQTALAGRDELISRLQDELAELGEQAEQRPADPSAEAAAQTALAERDELISQLQREVAELREQAEQRQDDQAHDTEVARVTDAAAAQIATVEAEAQSALAVRDERISELERELAELREQAEQPLEEDTTERDELQARLNEAAQAHTAEVARVTAAAAAHIAKLDAEVQTALAGRDELISELQRELAESREQAEQPRDEPAVDDATIGRAHLLFVPSASGYALIEFPGPDPPSGTVLDIDGVSYVVHRVGASPFPGSRLRCVFVEPV
jgi:hypothetical protein